MTFPVYFRVCGIFLLVNCVANIQGQLTFYLPSDKVSEGACNSPPPAVASNLKTSWVRRGYERYLFFWLVSLFNYTKLYTYYLVKYAKDVLHYVRK